MQSLQKEIDFNQSNIPTIEVYTKLNKLNKLNHNFKPLQPENKIPSFEELFNSISCSKSITNNHISFSSIKTKKKTPYIQLLQSIGITNFLGQNQIYLYMPSVILHGQLNSYNHDILRPSQPKNFVELSANRNDQIYVSEISKEIFINSKNVFFINSLSQKKSYVCGVCYKSFTTSGHLSRHKNLHSGEKKYICPWDKCNAKFLRKDNCKQHYKVHIKNSTSNEKNPRNIYMK